MSFVWFRPEGPLRSREQIAREVHAVSLARGLDELATVLTLMCIDVEAGADDDNGDPQWWCPWNAKDPTSKNYPHDSESDDGRSVGYCQQQNGAPGEMVSGSDNWWGNMRSRMTLALAADVFQTRLADDYGRAAGNPALAGQFIQRVQRSGYPDRYAERWDEAWAVLRRALAQGPVTPKPPLPPTGTGSPITRARLTSNRYVGRGGKTPRWIVVHTQEGGRSAWDLAGFLKTTEGQGPKAVSYNACVDDIETVLTVDWDDTPWSAAGANPYAFHICMAGSYAGWDRGKWLETDASDGKNEDLQLTRTAQLIAWLCRTYDIPVEYIGGNGIPWGREGICGHRDFGSWGGGHTDPGDKFPWDELIRRVLLYLDTNTGGFLMALNDSEQREILNYVRAQNQPIPSTSPLRHLGEGNVTTRANLPRAIDANQHVTAVVTLANEGHTPSIALLWEVSTAADAPGKYPDRQEDAKLAKTLLASISKAKVTVAREDIEAWLDAEKIAA